MTGSLAEIVLTAKFREPAGYIRAVDTVLNYDVEHIAPGIFASLMGHFSGDATEYRPTEPVELVRCHIELMAGRDRGPGGTG